MIDATYNDATVDDDAAFDYERFMDEYDEAVTQFYDSIMHLLNTIHRGKRAEIWRYRYRILNPYGDVAVEEALRDRHERLNPELAGHALSHVGRRPQGSPRLRRAATPPFTPT